MVGKCEEQREGIEKKDRERQKKGEEIRELIVKKEVRTIKKKRVSVSCQLL